jgi:hypothetical protein
VIHRTCLVCRAEFLPRARGGKPQVYCSPRCRQSVKTSRANYRKQPASMKRCAAEGCHHLFAPYRARIFCGDECKLRSRRCVTCKQTMVGSPTPTQRTCRGCHAAYKRRMREDPEFRIREVSAHRRSKFGLEPEQYAEMHATQNGVCAICGQAETATTKRGMVKTLAVDHDHATGKIRALLCTGCNTGIGLLRDSPERLRDAAAYIESHRERA